MGVFVRATWKAVLGGAGAIGISIAIAIIGHSPRASGDPVEASTPSSPSQAPPPGIGIPADELHSPLEPYEPGPSGIAYEQLSAADKAGVDLIQEAVETAQPETSYDAFAAATDWAGEHADKQISARAVGLVGAEADGVVP